MRTSTARVMSNDAGEQAFLFLCVCACVRTCMQCICHYVLVELYFN